MPIQLHIQKMEREADVIKKNEKSANDYLTQTQYTFFLNLPILYATIFVLVLNNFQPTNQCNLILWHT